MASFAEKVLVLCFLMSLAVSCDRLSLLFSEGKLYENDTFGFSAKYPRNWQVNDTGFMGSAVVFVAANNKLDFKPSVNIFVRPSDGLNLMQYVNRTKDGLNKEIKDFRYRLKKFTEEGKVKLGSYEGYELTYLFNQEGVDLKARSLFHVEGAKAYMLTCTAKEEDFPRFKEEFELVISSFRKVPK